MRVHRIFLGFFGFGAWAFTCAGGVRPPDFDGGMRPFPMNVTPGFETPGFSLFPPGATPESKNQIAVCSVDGLLQGDDIVGYVSLGKGVTIHRVDCKNARALTKNPERFTSVVWAGTGGKPFRVELQIEALDRSHLLEDVARTLSDSGANILAGSVQTLADGVVRDRFTLEVGDVRQLDNILANIRAISTVYDAYRVVGG